MYRVVPRGLDLVTDRGNHEMTFIIPVTIRQLRFRKTEVLWPTVKKAPDLLSILPLKSSAELGATWGRVN